LSDNKGIKTYYKGIGLCGFGVGSNSAEVDVRDGKIIRTRPMRWDKKYKPEEMNPWKIEARGKVFEPPMRSLLPPYSYTYAKKRAFSPNRIPFPMKRVDWNPDGERNTQNRGKSKYVRISWDEATDIIAKEIKRQYALYGNYSILVQTMGLVVSFYGLIAIFWQVFIPAASDYLGRKPALIAALFIGAAVPLALFVFPEGWVGKGVLTLLGGNCIVLTPLIMGVMVVESVPPQLSASASSLVSGLAQFAGSLFLSVTGRLADIYGLAVVMLVAVTAYAAAALLGMAFKETNPRTAKSGC